MSSIKHAPAKPADIQRESLRGLTFAPGPVTCATEGTKCAVESDREQVLALVGKLYRSLAMVEWHKVFSPHRPSVAICFSSLAAAQCIPLSCARLPRVSCVEGSVSTF